MRGKRIAVDRVERGDQLWCSNGHLICTATAPGRATGDSIRGWARRVVYAAGNDTMDSGRPRLGHKGPFGCYVCERNGMVCGPLTWHMSRPNSLLVNL